MLMLLKPDTISPQPTLTCSSRGQSCPSPSCPPVCLAWPPAGDSLAPGLWSAGRCLRHRRPRRDALWSGKQTVGGDINAKQLGVWRWLGVSVCVCESVLFWLHHKSAEPAPWLEPAPVRLGTACAGRISHSPEQKNNTVEDRWRMKNILNKQRSAKNWIYFYHTLTTYDKMDSCAWKVCST